MATRYPTRSIRIGDDTWLRAKKRAEAEGLTISRAMSMIVEGYAHGKIDLPRVQMVYPKRK